MRNCIQRQERESIRERYTGIMKEYTGTKDERQLSIGKENTKHEKEKARQYVCTSMKEAIGEVYRREAEESVYMRGS